MTRPKPDEQPTTVLPAQTVEQPAVSTAPATRRAGVWSHVPARIGRARTSTAIITSLFVLLFAVRAAVGAEPVEYTTITDANTGQSVRVPSSLVPSAPTTATLPTTAAPTTTRTPATTSRAPQSSADEEETTPASTSRAPSSSAPATTSRAPSSSRAPSTSAAPSATDEEPSASSGAPTS